MSNCVWWSQRHLKSSSSHVPDRTKLSTVNGGSHTKAGLVAPRLACRRWRPPGGSHTKSHPKTVNLHFAHVALVAPGYCYHAFAPASLSVDSGALWFFTEQAPSQHQMLTRIVALKVGELLRKTILLSALLHKGLGWTRR